MKRFLLFIFLLGNFSLAAQITEISFNFGSNFPLIPRQREGVVSNSGSLSPGYSSYYVNTGTVTESFEGTPGINLGSQIMYRASGRIFLSSGLSLQHIRYQRFIQIQDLSESVIFPIGTATTGSSYGVIYGTMHVRDPVTGNIIIDPQQPAFASSPRSGTTRITMMQVPVMAGTSILKDRLAIHTGVLISGLLHASVVKQNYSYNYNTGAFTFAEEMEKSNDDFTKISAGLILTVRYMITRRIGLDIVAQKQLQPLYSNESTYAGKARLNLFSLGLSCALKRQLNYQ